MRKIVLLLTIGILAIVGVSCEKEEYKNNAVEGAFIYLEEPYYDNMYMQEIAAHFIPDAYSDTSDYFIKFVKSEVPRKFRKTNDTIKVELYYRVATNYTCDRFPPNILLYIKEISQ
jgi:hypothetical protein